MPKEKIAEIPWEATEDSSNVHSLYWHEPSHTVCVRFNGGGLYSYLEVPEHVYMDFRHAESVGKYLNSVIKAYPYTRWDTEHELIDHLNI